MRFAWKIALAVAFLALLRLGQLAWAYYDPHSIAHESMQVQLKLFGSAVYEFHSATGRWPSRLNALAQTSLPARRYVWLQSASSRGRLWPQNLDPDPARNAGVLLAYCRGGLSNSLGRVWVCWGDLRTARLPE